MIRENCLGAGTRRQFLWQAGGGFAGVALAGLLERDGFFTGRASAAESVNLLAAKPPHRPTKVKSCIFLFMYGGPSQMDLFDYKPELQKHDGQTVNLEVRRNEVKPGKLLGSKRQWAQHGRSGLWVSDALPHLAKHADKLAVVNRHHIRDLHATILHQMGLDPNKLSYFYGGLEQRLVGVTGAEPIAGII